MHLKDMMRNLLTIALLLSSLSAVFAQSLPVSEQLINSTVQILTTKSILKDGISKLSGMSGTGFFFEFNTSKGKIPVIITNRHVVEGMVNQQFTFKLRKSDGSPDYDHGQELSVTSKDVNWLLHPDKSVDLAILPIAGIMDNLEKLKKGIFIVSLTEELIPSDSVAKSLLPIEDVLMVGYPFGLRDIGNNLPIVRRGITATSFYLDYNKKKEFLCDIPVYPGSSGSPIMILNQQGFVDRKGTVNMGGTRALLLGINYATYTADFEGKITPVQALADPKGIYTSIPYNIAIVIKSERILDFKPLLLNLIQ